MKNNEILNHQDIINKTRRIAYQILESNVNEKDLILAGIEDNGYAFAKLIKKELNKISEIDIILCSVTINKTELLAPIHTSLNKENYKEKSIILVDDVLNSGGTLMYGVKHFLEVNLKRFKTAVLINRNHKKYPVKADFKGISLSTSLHEHVTVNIKNEPFSAVLN